MAGGVAWHVDDVKAQAQHVHPVSLRHRCEGGWNVLACRAINRGPRGFAQRLHAAYMVGMVVRD